MKSKELKLMETGLKFIGGSVVVALECAIRSLRPVSGMTALSISEKFIFANGEDELF